jgi:UDP:flavonoid glycosyltransferase YjiC (YdhE family)
MPASRVLLTCFGSYGDVNPYVGLALALRARGHAPAIATSAFYREYVEREGIAFHPVRPDVDPDDRALVARIMDPARGTEFLLRELILPALGQSWADLDAAARGADLLVSHPVTFAAPLVAEERGLPWASSVLAPMSFFSPHDLPVFAPLPGLRHLGRVPAVARLLVRAARAVSRPWTRPVRALRAERGLPASGDALFEGQHSPALVLALFSRVLAAPQPDWPARVRVTGAIPYNGPGGALPSALARFLDAGPAPLVFTLGSSAVAAAGDFYVESAAAARRLGMRAVLLTGRHAENRARVAAGDDLLLVEHAPHRDLLPRAAAVVHQGGIGTLHQALRAGRPQLVVPWAHDQPDNAHRAARLGVARVLYPREYRAARVERTLRALLEPPVAARAAAVADAVRAEDGAAAACGALEACLGGGAGR